MRFIAIADTHLGFEAGKTSAARKYTYERMFNAFEEISQIAKEKNVDYLLHGGDIFNRSKPRKKVVKRTYEIIQDLLEADIGFLVAPGNHERSKLPATLLRYHPKSHFFFAMTSVDFDVCTIVGFPFEPNLGGATQTKLSNLVKQLDQKSCLILCHQLFDGSEFGPHKFRFSITHGAIDPLLFPQNVKLIVTGHIHRAQALMNGFVVYPGSTERTSFVEVIEPKGFLLMDIDSNSLSVKFNELNSTKMDVMEINLLQQELDIGELSNKIERGFVRTLLRFTGRALTTSEFETIKNEFPNNDYPLLTVSPKFPKQVLKPLYEKNMLPFNFPDIIKNF